MEFRLNERVLLPDGRFGTIISRRPALFSEGEGEDDGERVVVSLEGEFDSTVLCSPDELSRRL
jgi:hypothetical protein